MQPLETIVALYLNSRRFRKAGYEAVDRICDYYQSLAERPVVAQVEPGYLAKLIPGHWLSVLSTLKSSDVLYQPMLDHAPEEGEPFSSIADDFQKVILPGEASGYTVSYLSGPDSPDSFFSSLWFYQVSRTGSIPPSSHTSQRAPRSRGPSQICMPAA